MKLAIARWVLPLTALTWTSEVALAAQGSRNTQTQTTGLARFEPWGFGTELSPERDDELPCGEQEVLRLPPLVWGKLESPLDRPLFALAPGAEVTGVFASLRVVELEEQRKTRLLDRLQFAQAPAIGGAGDLLAGDLVGAAGVAASALSLSVKFGGKKAATELLLDDSDPERALWSFGLGLGRLGVRLRSDW